MASGSRRTEARAEVSGDDLRDGYSHMADDGTQSERAREAAMLFSVAEAHLDSEDFEEALLAAGDALAAFRELADLRGSADALRVTVKAHRALADKAFMLEDDRTAADSLQRAEDLAREELEVFRGAGDKRGEASMLLALAEVFYEQKNEQKCEDALNAAEDALALFGEVEDPRMEATACLVLSRARFDAKQVVAAKRAGNDAVTLFKSLGDRKREAAAWGSLGSVQAMDFCYEEAIRCERRRLKIGVELGDKKMQAVATYLTANWALIKNDVQGAIAQATAALQLFRELDRPSGLWEASACGLLADAHVFEFEQLKAVEVLSEALDGFRRRGDDNSVIRTLFHMVSANPDHEEALRYGEEAVELCRKIGAARMEAKLLEAMAYVHIARNSPEEAKKAAFASVEALGQHGSSLPLHQEAYCKAHMFVLAKILVHLGLIPEAAKACDTALRIARENEDRCVEGQAMLAVCGAQAMQGNTDKALKAGELAAEIFHEIGGNYRIDEAKAYQSLAEIHFETGQLSQALRAITQAENLLQNFGDKRRLAKLKHTRVNIHQAMGDFQEAVKAAIEALKISRAEDDMHGTIESLFKVIEAIIEHLARQASEGEKRPRRVFQQQCEKAMRYAKEAIGLSIKTKSRSAEGAAYNWMAHLQIMTGKLSEAMQSAETGRSLFQEVGDKPGEAHSLALIAQAEMAKSDSKAASKTLAEAMAIAKEVSDEMLIKFIQELQGQISGGKTAAAGPALGPLEADAAAETPSDAAPAAAASGAVDAFVAPDPNIVKSFIIGMVQNMTGGAEGEIDGDTPLMDSGIDSLASVELRTQLQSEFRVNLPSTVMFNYPTISGMSELLVDEMTNKKIAWDH